MKRDLKKCIAEYDRKYTGGSDKFYYSDIKQIKQIAEDRAAWISIEDTTYHAITSALKAGFMIGYRCAQRESRKQDNS